MAYRDTVLADSPVDFYEMESSTGTDSGSGNRTLTLNNGVTTGVAGKPTKAWQFDGTNDYASATSFPAITTAFTIEAWFKSNTNAGWSNQYQTIIRRDGTDIVIIRGVGSSEATNPGKIEAYIAGTFVRSAGRLDDGNWHHVVLRVSGNSATLYVDGASSGTATVGKSTYSFGSGGFNIGADNNGTGEFYKGVLDSVAIYTTALSATQITNHYNANPANGGYNAEVATGSGMMPAGVYVPKNVNHAATPMTATGLVVDPKRPKTQRLAATDDGDGQTSFQSTTLLASGTDNGFSIKFGGSSLPSDAQVTRVLFEFEVYSTNGSPTLNIHRATADWTEGPSAEAPSYDSLVLASIAVPATGKYQVDVTALWNEWASNPNYGLVGRIGVAAKQVAIYSRESTGFTKPSLIVEYLSEGNTNIAAGPLTATGVLVAPVVSNVTHKTFGASVATATAFMVDPAVIHTGNADVAAEVMTSDGEMPQGSNFSVPVNATAELMTATATMVDASAASDQNALAQASVMTGSSVLPQVLLEINGEVINPSLGTDRYWTLMTDTTDSDDFWYRLDENSGSVVHDARGNAAKDADLAGAYSFGIYGPESRKAVRFTDGYFKRRWASEAYGLPQGQSATDDSDTSQFAFEVVLRTTDGNGIIAYGLDRANPAIETGPVPYFRNSIFLKDGKVTTNWNYAGRSDSMFELGGVTNVADGNWHHIVVAFNDGPVNNLNSGLRIYVDGKLDVRRRRDIVPGVWASPDSYFGMPEAWRNVTPLYPWQKNFNGDVMEVAFRYEDWLTHDDVNELFYAVFGIVPVRTTPAIAVGQMPEPVVKGNRKRALVLYTKWNAQGLFNRIGDERNAPSSFSTTIPDEFDHNIDIGRIYEPGESPWIELAGYRVEAASIMREDSEPLGGPYRDPVTDLPRLIDLQDDLNMANYDLIVFRNWPDEGADEEVFRQRGYDNASIEAFLASVKKAVVDGAGLEVTNVGLAARLGLIDGALPIPMMYDRVGFDEKDVRGAQINPWEVDKTGNTYLDMHANNWHRITAVVPNLTDIAGTEAITEAYSTYNSGTNGEVNNKWGYKLSNEPLKIGDEILDPAVFWNKIMSYGNDGPVTLRPWNKYLWAVTPNGLRAGTPVYRFNNAMYENGTAIANPYKDYIGGAIVQPGDLWGGERIAGKVFMNFGEAPFLATTMGLMTRQIVPPNDQIINPFDREDAAKREWDYSYTRVAFSSTGGLGGDQRVEVQEQPDGSFALVGKSRAGSLVGISIIEKYPTETVVVPTWALRGLAWLAVTESVPSGSVVIRPTAMEATAALEKPVTVAQRSVGVSVPPALARGVLVAPAEAHDPDVTVAPFPMEAFGSMTGYGKTITVAPMLGSAELVDNFDLISARGEQVVLILHGLKEVEIYLNEGVK